MVGRLVVCSYCVGALAVGVVIEVGFRRSIFAAIPEIYTVSSTWIFQVENSVEIRRRGRPRWTSPKYPLTSNTFFSWTGYT